MGWMEFLYGNLFTDIFLPGMHVHINIPFLPVLVILSLPWSLVSTWRFMQTFVGVVKLGPFYWIRDVFLNK